MFRQGIRRSFRELMFRGALSLICCAIVALCVGGLLSALAENLGPTPPTNDAGRKACKTINCVLSYTGSRSEILEPFAFDAVYGAFSGRGQIDTNGKQVVAASRDIARISEPNSAPG